MLTRVLRDGAVYGFAAILSRGIAFFLLPLYTWALDPGEYGAVDMLVVFGSLVNVTVSLEISQAVARFHPDVESAEEKVRYASTALWFTVGAYALFWAAGAVASARLAGWILDSTERAPVMQVALVSTFVYGLFYLVQNQLRLELRPVPYAAASVALTLVTLGVAGVLLGVLRMGLMGVVWAQLAGNAAGAAVAFSLARGSFRPVFDGKKLRGMLRFSLPLVPAGVAAFIALYVDRIAIKQLMTLSDVGVFGVGYRIASVAGLLMVAFQGALMPLIYTHYREPGTPESLARIFRYFVAAALVLCLGLSVFAREIIALVTTQDYRASATVVPLLVPAVLLSTMYIFAPGLAIAKRTGTIAAIGGAAAAANTALNFALIPLLGIRGAALATSLSAGGSFALSMATSQRLYPVPHRWGALGLATAAMVALSWAAFQFRAEGAAAALSKAGIVATFGFLVVHLGLVPGVEIRRAVHLLRLKVGRLMT